MRHFLIFCLFSMFLFLSCSKDNETDPYEETVTSLGTNSTLDVYFSFAQGEVNSVVRSDWDLAFSTAMQSATIRINEGSDAELYCVGDTTEWNTYTTFDPADHTELLNDKADWSMGAFNINHDKSNVFNFGWGTYNMSDHIVYADSIYVLKLTDGSSKKLFIRKRFGTTGVYLLRWANIDGSEQVDASFSCAPYFNVKHFIHYSLVNQEIVEAEPDKGEWDLLFTRYNIIIPTGPGTSMKYPVMGILGNPNVSVAEVTGLPPESANISDSPEGFVADADAIGYDWKESHPVTHEISLVDSVSYFVQAVDGNTYQLFFTDYGGMEQGTITFKTRLLE